MSLKLSHLFILKVSKESISWWNMLIILRYVGIIEKWEHCKKNIPIFVPSWLLFKLKVHGHNTFFNFTF